MLKIAVLGGGNGAFITAADLSIKGFDVTICEAPQMAGNIKLAKERGGIELEVRGNPGLKGGFAKMSLITADFKEALKDRDIVFVIVPAFAQRIFAECSADALSPDQIVVLEPGNFGGSLEFAELLKNRGIREIPVLVELECMIYSGFKNDSGSVWVSGFKNGLKAAAYPGKFTAPVLDKLTKVYPGLDRAENILETGLSNINTVVHAPILALNAGWVEHTRGKFLFYWHGVTPAVGRVVEAVEEERMSLGSKLGVRLSPSRDTLIKWYGHQGANGASLTEVLRTNPAYEWDEAPPSMLHRFFLEDIPYGMIPMETLGAIIGVDTPIISSTINFGVKLTGKNLREEARDLRQLGLDSINAKELIKKVTTGGEDSKYFR
jgi:opine dehydrogenase